MLRPGSRPRIARYWCLLTVAVLACSRNPATGRLQWGLPEQEDEVELGQRADGEVRQEYPAYDELPAATKLLADVGRKVASATERSELPWSFTILDDPMVNAFALPGGYVYVTRGLLAHLGSDDELAAVLAHEAAHVSARHGVVQLRKQEVARRSVGLFRIVDPNLRHIGGIAARSAGLALLRYSREDEHEADDLALRYVRAAGWNPRSVVRVLDILAEIERRKGSKVPPWLSTHPDSHARRSRTAGALGITAPPSTGAEPEYLRAIDGIAFGDDPRDGFLSVNTFVHPRIGFQVDLPARWRVGHRREHVLAVSEDERALMIVMPTKYESPAAGLADFFADPSLTAGDTWQGKVGGLAVVSKTFAMNGDDGRILGLAAFVALGRRTMALVALGPEQGWSARSDAIATSFGSFAPIEAALTARVVPLRIRVVELPGETTIAALESAEPSAVDVETAALINGVTKDTPLPAGRLIKRVLKPRT